MKYIGIKRDRRQDRIRALLHIKGTRIYGPSRELKDIELSAKDYDLLCIKYNRKPKNGFYTKLI